MKSQIRVKRKIYRRECLTVESNVFQNAMEWMSKRNWKQLVAKRRQYDQSLFEHTLVELDVTLQLLPILRLPHHFSLSPEEEQILLASIVAHDVGKERAEWQEYILGQRGFLSDVDPVLTSSILPDLCTALGFSGLDQKVMAVIENCVNLHMSHERSEANIISAIFKGTDRWYTLANLVYHIDNVCSAKGVFEAKAALERSPLKKHLKTAYHQVTVRGVSTTALHQAALESFKEAGWVPLLHFSDATLYACSAAIQSKAELPKRNEIIQRLAKTLDRTMARDVTTLIVGNERQNFLPKPELFDYREVKTYLQEASRRANPLNFKKKSPKYRDEVVKNYLALREDVNDKINDSLVDFHSERIGSARPEMAVFRFFKCAMDSNLIGADGVKLAEQEYNKVFGQGTWDNLKSMSTYMPALDMAKRVDSFWKLPGKQFGINIAHIEEVAIEKRIELLIEILVQIANTVYTSIPSPPTRENSAYEMATSFIQDLVSPAAQVDLAELAKKQMESYNDSKPFAGKQIKKARYLCPICNMPFEGGTKAAADFIDNPQSHTNRGVAHSPFGYITICDTCKHERILRQLLLGERASELIVIFPRMNIGPGAGELLVHKAQALYDRAYTLMVGDTDDPDRRLWLTFTSFIAEQMFDQDICRLTPEQIADLLSYQSGEEKRRKNLRELQKRLKEEYEDDLEAANIAWGTELASWEEATSAIYTNRVIDPIARQIRAEVYQLYPQMQLICQTPHMIMLPVSYSIKLGDDSEANAALRRTFIALLLGLNLNASVAIVRDSDQIDFQGGDGVAYVPPVAAVREMIGCNWIPLNEAGRWFRRIGIASILASAGQYSKRSGLLEVLTTPTVGHILRRIEQKREAEKRSLRYQDIAYLRAFEEVMANL
jgi:hypothetical protein